MTAPNDQAPLTDAEADALLRPWLEGRPALVLAVSGGVDSMVLLHLAAGVVRRQAIPVTLVVATIDHGLRPEAAAEASFVAAAAGVLGLTHRTCVWSGVKPATALPAAARAARYGLLAEAAQQAGAGAIMTAHSRDDQAETVLMRLARGSGVDGLSGMALLSTLPEPHSALKLLRPLLDIPKSRLTVTAQARSITWREDPSNANDAFERPRIRKALALLEDLGVSGAAIARSARRLGAARAALLSETVTLLADPTFLHLDPLGFAKLDRVRWLHVPSEIRIRVLAAVIRHVGGEGGFLALARLEAIERGLAEATFAETFARTKISRHSGAIRIQREYARTPAQTEISAGQSLIWDNRFRVTRFARQDGAADGFLTVRQLGPDGLKFLRERGHVAIGVSAEILHATPSFWAGRTVLSSPPLATLIGGQEPVSVDGGMWFLGRDHLIGRVSRQHSGY